MANDWDDLGYNLSELTKKCDRLMEQVEGLSAELGSTVRDAAKENRDTQRELAVSTMLTLQAIRDRFNGLVKTIVITAIIVGFGSAFLIGRSANPTITSYPAVRQADGTLKALEKIDYRIKLAKNTITCWGPGCSTHFLNLFIAQIYDKKNWRASGRDGYDSSNRTVQMEKGKIVMQHYLMQQDPNEIYIGRVHWWLLRVGIIRK